MKNILVPTDFSDYAIAAEELGLELAKKANAEIHFLHLLQTPVEWVKLPLEKEKLYPETKAQIGHAKSELKKLRIRAEKMGLVVKDFLVFDKGRGEIHDHIGHHDHDFIVMGSNGASGIKEKVIGSNAQQIIRKASVPVLVVKKPVVNPIRKIVFASDFKDVSKDSFHTLTHFADVLGGHIDLLFVNTPKEFIESKETSQNMENLMRHCDRKDSCTGNVVNAATVEEGIHDFVAENPMDLIAICTHGKSGIRQLFSPSIAERLANHADVPLLSIKL